jgi:DNA-binding transcriptional MerR regulator/effector-binding domain-containing protein
MFRVSAFARLGGVSAKVLRDYDEARLFRPAYVDPDSGYRLYSPAQLPLLRRIVGLREIGVGLADIRALVVDGADLAATLERRRRELEATRRDAERQLAALGISVSDGKAGGRARQLDVVVRHIGSELVAAMDVKTAGGDVGGAFYELERAIREAGVRALGPPGALVRRRPAAGSPGTEVYVPVRRRAERLEVRRLPAERAATVLHAGPYEALPATRRALERWLARHGLRAAEPVRLVYLQFGAERDLRLPGQFLVSTPEAMLTEIQVPLAD